jgi:hypothetical protein
MHLQVFDVADPAHPRRRFHQTFSTKGAYSYSAAQYDHHAFTYDPVTGTLALPYNEYNNGISFQGLIAYHIDPKRGFKQIGRIDHRSIADTMLAYTCAQMQQQHNGSETYYCNKANWPSLRQQYGIDRSIVVDKYLMTLGSAGLMIHTLAGADQVAALSWARVQDHAALAQ